MPSETSYGDRAGEHLTIARGKYDAKDYVFVGFLLVAATLGVVFLLATALVLEPPWTKSWQVDRQWREHTLKLLIGPDFVIGLALAWLAFRDRWKCIEHVSSRYCSGYANLSFLYVPLISAGYGVLRGLRKLRGR